MQKISKTPASGQVPVVLGTFCGVLSSQFSMGFGDNFQIDLRY